MRALVIGLALVLLTACSRRPSTSDIEHQLAGQIAGCDNLLIKDVRKIDGYEDGDNRYVAEVTYVVEIGKAKTETIAEVPLDEAVNSVKCLAAELPLLMAGAASGDASRAAMHQDLVMRRTDNGWRLIESTDR